MKTILMLAGEPSGDLHASNLALELKRCGKDLRIIGTGGEKMRSAGVEILFDLKTLAVTGLIGVIKNYAKLKKIQTSLLAKIKKEKIDLIILVDYPDFNLRFAKKAQGSGVPIIYYISPQVWAWRRGRVNLIKKYIKKIFVIFKFEEELYKKEGIDAEFIGHPLLDIVRPSLSREAFFLGLRPAPCTLHPASYTVALLPGSRKRLVKKHLPIMLKAANIISKKLPDARFLISKSPSLNKTIYDQALKKHVGARNSNPVIARSPDSIGTTKQSLFSIVENGAYDLINASDAVLVISGTATLETAILGKPMVIIYKLPALEYILAKPLLRVKNIGLVNILAGKEIVPELIQLKARPARIAGEMVQLLTDEKKREGIINALAHVKNTLYPDGAAKRAAQSIVKLLESA